MGGVLPRGVQQNMFLNRKVRGVRGAEGGEGREVRIDPKGEREGEKRGQKEEEGGREVSIERGRGIHCYHKQSYCDPFSANLERQQVIVIQVSGDKLPEVLIESVRAVHQIIGMIPTLVGSGQSKDYCGDQEKITKLT